MGRDLKRVPLDFEWPLKIMGCSSLTSTMLKSAGASLASNGTARVEALSS